MDCLLRGRNSCFAHPVPPVRWVALCLCSYQAFSWAALVQSGLDRDDFTNKLSKSVGQFTLNSCKYFALVKHYVVSTGNV